MFIAALCITVQLLQLVIIAKRGKKPRHPSVDEWINKVWCIRAMKYYSALNRNEFLTHATAWMNLEGIMLSSYLISASSPFMGIL